MKSSLQWTVCEPLQMFYIWLSSQLVWKSFKKEQFGFFLRWLARPKVRLRRKILGFLIWDKVSMIGNYSAKKRNFKILQNHILKTTIWINQFDYYYSGFGISNHSKLDFPLQFYREIQRFEYATAAKRIFSTSTRPLCSLKTVHILANRQFCKQRTHSFLR